MSDVFRDYYTDLRLCCDKLALLRARTRSKNKTNEFHQGFIFSNKKKPRSAYQPTSLWLEGRLDAGHAGFARQGKLLRQNKDVCPLHDVRCVAYCLGLTLTPKVASMKIRMHFSC